MVALTHRGERLGVIGCGPTTEGELTADDHELLTTLAAQAAIAVANARLATELAAHLGDIRHQADERRVPRASPNS
jgi:GAF domain-containing protein